MKKSSKPLERLQAMIPSPVKPRQAGPSERRPVVEKSLGTHLPDEQYEIGIVYGSGSFGIDGNPRIIYVYNPFAKSFAKKVKEWSEGYRSLKGTKDKRAFPYGVYPDSPGLLTCGVGERRALFWLTEGEPEKWPLVLLDPDDKFHRYDLSLTEFLHRLFSGKIGEYGGDLDAVWFKSHKEAFVFTPDGPKRQSRKK